MEQETAQQLFAVEGHHLVLSVAVVLVGQFDLTALEVKQAGIAQCSAVAVAAQVVDHGLGVGQTGLGVDDPLGAHQGIKHGVDLSGAFEALEPAGFDGLAQGADETPTHMARECPYREQIGTFGRLQLAMAKNPLILTCTIY